MRYGLGCQPYTIDERDYKFNDLINCGAVYPIEYISPLPSYRLNQGNTNMCAAFAISTARYMYELNDSRNTELFSFSYIYANRATTDYKGEGLVIRQALNNLIKSGVCYLKSFDDMGDYQSVHRKYTTRMFTLNEEAYPYRVSSYYLLNNDNEIKQAVITTGSAVVSYNVWDNWYNVKSDGKIPNVYGKYYGGHAVLIVGWTANNEWIILNSWGDNWGDNGLGYISMSQTKNEVWCIVDNVQEIFFQSLKDIQKHWAYSSIDKAVRKGIIKGYEDETFKPDNNLTRAEVCAIIAKLNKFAECEVESDGFVDIPSNAWYKNYVYYCKNKGYITGYEDGTFRPLNALTRAEATKILCNICNINVSSSDNCIFNDIESHWGKDYIMAMYKKGAINGYETGNFAPNDKITRAEFITMIDRLKLLN